jgi:hypothetical protein
MTDDWMVDLLLVLGVFGVPALLGLWFFVLARDK